MPLSEILALVILVVIFGVMMWGKKNWYIPALIGAGIVVVIALLIVMLESHLNFGQPGISKFLYH
jgi:hypothetical protein